MTATRSPWEPTVRVLTRRRWWKSLPCTRRAETVFFYNIEFIRLITSLKQKINEESGRSLYVANDLLDSLEDLFLENDMLIEDVDISFQIHCDIGRSGKTNVLIKEIVSWVTSQGYVCLIKPDSYAASSIADRLSKWSVKNKYY